ncbi:hypothetical protein B0H10DRAFT_2437698 [Mycena sp. CBHHK59/15]|nr:hypothetical protein B0H10DRAFT_2437698 [Mycena sp. CBHHK59/15]
MTRVVYGLVVQDGAVQNGAIKVKLTDTVEDVLDLTRQIGQDFPALPAQNAVVWLPSEFLASGPLGAEDLRVQLAERSLADIAQDPSPFVSAASASCRGLSRHNNVFLQRSGHFFFAETSDFCLILCETSRKGSYLTKITLKRGKRGIFRVVGAKVSFFG